MQNLGKLEEFRQEAEEFLITHWKDAGKKVITECNKVVPYDDTIAEFLKWECSTCGGDWGKWFLSGVKRVFPEVWDAIPNEMGFFAWECICYTCLLCGIDTTA